MAYVVWRKGRYAELVRGVREGDRVRQVRLAYLGARPRLTPAVRARVEAQCPGGVDWARIEAAILARGGQVADEDDYGLPEGPRPILWAYFEALRRGLLWADEPAPWTLDGPPPQRPSRVAERDASRYLWPRFARAMLGRPDLGELLRDPLQLRRVCEEVFDDLRAALEVAREVRAGRWNLEKVTRDMPRRRALAEEILAQLAEAERREEARRQVRCLGRGGRVGTRESPGARAAEPPGGRRRGGRRVGR